jgi:hypothetical protein
MPEKWRQTMSSYSVRFLQNKSASFALHFLCMPQVDLPVPVRDRN